MIARHSTPAGIAGRRLEADMAMYPINDAAPVKEVSIVTIAAPKDTVWGLLIDTENHKSVPSVVISNPRG